jgi:hypothetical protein
MFGAAFAASVLTLFAGTASANAQQVKTTGCIGTFFSVNCVTRWAPAGDPYLRYVPPPADAAAAARLQERERHWANRCRPVLAPDRYGVARYRYAAPGCEFGVGEN